MLKAEFTRIELTENDLSKVVGGTEENIVSINGDTEEHIVSVRVSGGANTIVSGCDTVIINCD